MGDTWVLVEGVWTHGRGQGADRMCAHVQVPLGAVGTVR